MVEIFLKPVPAVDVSRETNAELLEFAEGIYRKRRKVSFAEADKLRKVEGYSNVHSKEGYAYYLEYGDRFLLVDVEFYEGGEGYFKTHVEKFIGSSRKREKNQTTCLYMAARKVMDDCAREHGQDFEYELETDHKKMRDWATERGGNIFQWKNEWTEKDEDEVYYLFSTTITAK